MKSHEEEALGRIIRLFPDKQYGFLESDNVGEVYFHANSVANAGFDKLFVGGKVHYQAAPGEKGLQATVVKLVRSPRKVLALFAKD